MLIYTSYSDVQLMNLLKQSDEKAFSELYDRYWDNLFVVASSKLKNPAEAEEIVQDIFLDIWKRRKEISLTNVKWRTKAPFGKY